MQLSCDHMLAACGYVRIRERFNADRLPITRVTCTISAVQADEVCSSVMPCCRMSSEMGKVRMRVSRRQVLVQAAAIATGVGAFRTNRLIAADAACSDRVAGLLLGGLIGDALGGPVEFADGEKVAGYLLGTRDWPASRTMTADDRAEWAETLPLLSYEKLRPDAVPYGPWRESADAGTVTDDSRHKIVLIRAIREAVAQEQATLTAADLARQYLDFKPIAGVEPDADTQKLCEEGFAEYRMAARWLLGDRDEALALPVERLWAGIANCSGQMMLPPLAAAYVGRLGSRLPGGIRDRFHRRAAGSRLRRRTHRWTCLRPIARA